MADRSQSAQSGWKTVPPEHAPLLRLWLTRRGELHRICLHWARGSRSDAEDLLSDAMVRALEAIGSGSTDVTSPRAWLSTIIANLGRDRRRGAPREVPFDLLLGPDLGQPGVARIHDEDAEDALHARRELARILAAPGDLTSAQRRVLIARCLGESYRNIAHHLRVTEPEARRLAHSAREQLKAEVRWRHSGMGSRASRGLRRRRPAAGGAG